MKAHRDQVGLPVQHDGVDEQRGSYVLCTDEVTAARKQKGAPTQNGPSTQKGPPTQKRSVDDSLQEQLGKWHVRQSRRSELDGTADSVADFIQTNLAMMMEQLKVLQFAQSGGVQT
jgi:hypothetical protein